MAINPALLIAAPMMQDIFIDDTTGTVMAGGVITMYQDNSRSILKNWYYQTGAPGNYSFLPLANPMTLSASGTITDPYGNDTIPFYYPFSETDNETQQPYYVTVVNSNGQAQFSRQNFPYNVVEAPVTEVPTLNNLIENGVFYHNGGNQALTNQTNIILSPGASEGFHAANLDQVRFIKNNTGGIDGVTFVSLIGTGVTFQDNITPEVYLGLACSGATTGETLKAISFPIQLHMDTLQNQLATFTIQAQNSNAAYSGVINIAIHQYCGSGATPQDIRTIIGTINLTTSWQKYTVQFNFPSIAGLNLGNADDDAYYLEIQYPLNQLFSINIACPELYLGPTVPTNFFQTYDTINNTLSSPKTGDIRVAINSFSPYGWVFMNDGTIGNATSRTGQIQARWNVDTWQLFYLLWTTFQAQQSYAPMVNSSGGSVSYGASAIADWNANNAITLPKTLGRALCSAGLASSGGSTTWALGQSFGEQNHTQTVNEMAAHTHNVNCGGEIGPPNNFILKNSIAGDLSETTTPIGDGVPFNVTQPSIFYNVFMKL